MRVYMRFPAWLINSVQFTLQLALFLFVCGMAVAYVVAFSI